MSADDLLRPVAPSTTIRVVPFPRYAGEDYVPRRRHSSPAKRGRGTVRSTVEGAGKAQSLPERMPIRLVIEPIGCENNRRLVGFHEVAGFIPDGPKVAKAASTSSSVAYKPARDRARPRLIEARSSSLRVSQIDISPAGTPSRAGSLSSAKPDIVGRRGVAIRLTIARLPDPLQPRSRFAGASETPFMPLSTSPNP